MNAVINRPISPLNVFAYKDVPTADVRLRDPETGRPTDTVVTLAGPEHPTRKRIMFDRQRRMRSQLMRNGGKLQLQDPEEDDADETDLLVACIMGWEHMPAGDDPTIELPFSPQAARDMVNDPERRWLRDQLKTALDERERFIRRSEKA